MPQPLMYTELAEWFHLITAPEEYAEEAAIYTRAIEELLPEAQTMLELGSGGGNNAWHLKQRFQLTMTDLSPAMLALAQRLNPSLPAFPGDMRSIRLEQTFDVVFVHDAVMYMTTEDDLRAAMATAYAHLRPGGLAVFCPDHYQEAFQPTHSVFGADPADTPLGVAATPALANRSLRYLEWSYDPDPTDTTAIEDFAYLLREGSEPARCIHDRHIFGLFPHATWMRLLAETGFTALARPFEHSEVPAGQTELFIGMKQST